MPLTLETLINTLVAPGLEPGDSKAQRWRKHGFVMSLGANFTASLLGGLAFAALGLWRAAWVGLAAALICVALLLAYHLTKRVALLLHAFNSLNLVFPFVVQAMLGGFASSGGTCMWAMVTPLVAQMDGLPLPGLWFLGFVLMATGSALVEALGLCPSSPMTPMLSTIFWVGNLGGLTGVIHVTLKHTTRLKEALQAQLEEQHVRGFFAGLPMPAALFDRSLRVLASNAGLAQQEGRAGESLDGMEARALMPAPARLMALDKVLATGEPVVLEEASNHQAFTHYFYPYRGADGQVEGAAFFTIDLTAQQRAQQAEQRASVQAQLLHSEKMASIGVLAAGMAHEINNPLAALTLNLSILKERLQGEDVAPFLTRADTAISRITRIVDGLRVYARSDNEAMKPLDLHQVIRDTLTLMEPILRKAGVELVLQLECTAPCYMGNAGRTQQLIMNLLANARDAVAGRPGARVLLRTQMGEGRILLLVSDNGPGVAPELRARAFEPFFTTKELGKGTGLGLSISRGIAESMGGTLSLDADHAPGACFILALPSQALPAEPEMAEAPKAGAEQLSGRVLLVEDEEGIRLLLGMLLEGLGLKVGMAMDGLEGLERLGREDYDFVITDLQMPKLSGDQLVERSRSLPHCAQTAFVVITGNELASLPGPSQALFKSMGAALVRKPFSKEQLAQALRDARDKRGVLG